MLFSSDSDSDSDIDINNHLKIGGTFDVFEGNGCILKPLGKWAVAYNITLASFSSLLKVLKTNKTKQVNDIQIVAPGLYYHFGVANGLNSFGGMLVNFNDVIKIVIGIDGLPLTKSSSSTF